MKRLGLATLALLAPAGAAHAGEFSGNVSLVSDYVFRGVSLSDGDAAVQGGFDWVDQNFYVGTWGSSLTDGVELDLYAGFTPTTGPITWDFAVLGYFYPGADDEAAELDYFEFMASGTFSFTESFSVRPALYVAPENYGDTGEATYIELSAAYEMTDAVVFSGTFGSQSVEDPDGPFGAADEDTYSSWNLGAAYVVEGFTLDLRYHNTDIDAGSDIEAYTTGPDSYDGAFVFSISRGL